jgi:hypothetical protein
VSADGPKPSLTGELRAAGVHVEAVDEALAGIEHVATQVLGEQARGGTDLPDGFVRRVANAIRLRSKKFVQTAVWDTHMRARNYDTPPAAHEQPTARVEFCPTCKQPKETR